MNKFNKIRLFDNHNWSSSGSNLCLELLMIDMSFSLETSLLTESFLSFTLNNLASWSDSEAFFSHQCMNTSITIYRVTVIMMNTYGMIPMNPWKELLMIAGNSLVVSLMAVGANSMKTPILQISRSSRYGMILSRIDGILIKYFWSSLGPQA